VEGTATPNHDLIDRLTGDWNVEVTYIIGGKEQRGSAQMRGEWTLDHHFVKQEYHSPMGGADFVTLQFFGYDSVRRKFTILKMDSLDDAMLFADGEASADRRSITFTGERSDMMTRTVGKLRQVVTLTDADHFTLEWFLTGSDGKETKTVTMVHTRK
jgi:Protein of unknown function (DUF1579)